jgi:hypothetical protein
VILKILVSYVQEAPGCHHGDFKSRMLPLRLCPGESGAEYQPHGDIREDEINDFCRAQC